MKTMVIYDSVFGNTEQIAQEIGSNLGNQEDIAVLKVTDVRLDQLEAVKLLIVGSPTQRFNPLPAISNLLKKVPANTLKGVKVAAFDTRLTMKEINETPVLAFFVRIFGQAAYAAKHMASSLRKTGAELVVPPEGFYVEGMKGPLVQGELERAANWAKQISTAVS